MTPQFLRAMIGVLEHEGGFSDDPHDPGGQTRWGISRRSYPHEDIAHLTLERALELYWRDYWTALSSDQLPFFLAGKLLDVAVNVGVSWAVCLLQESLNRLSQKVGDELVVDGVLGAVTLRAVHRTSSGPLMAMLCGVQWQFYQTLVEQKPELRRFLAGWTVRAIYQGVR